MPGPRVHLNRVITTALLFVALPHVAMAERVRKGSGPRVARRWVRAGGRWTGVRFEQGGTLAAQPGGLQLLAANHSSPLDIAAILATHPSARFVAGADLFKIPLLASAMRAVGTVPVDRKSGAGRLEVPEGDHGVLTVFPEGAIAPRGRRLPFHRGAFALAIATGAEVVPVAIHHSARSLPPQAALGVRPGTVVVEYLPAISTRGLESADRHHLCQQVEESILAALDRSDGGRSPV